VDRPETGGVTDRLRRAGVVPAHPLALTKDGNFDELRQRALTRYYLDSGADGLAVGVHSTQFESRRADEGLLEPVLSMAAETARAWVRSPEDAPLLIAGACGPTDQAVAEAELAARLDYDAVLLSPAGLLGSDESALLDRARAVADVLPVIGFYMQPAVGGRHLSSKFWQSFTDLAGVVAIKLAPFNRYWTVEAIRGVAGSPRSSEVVLLTGNDDNIVADLMSHFFVGDRIGGPALRITGGLLGQFGVWTSAAVRLLNDIRAADTGDPDARERLDVAGPQLTDANAAIFDAENNFAGCIPGINEILCRQGLLSSRRTLVPTADLSPGQAHALDRVCSSYPVLNDDEFVATHLDTWLT